jgi:hypothetical protein
LYRAENHPGSTVGFRALVAGRLDAQLRFDGSHRRDRTRSGPAGMLQLAIAVSSPSRGRPRRTREHLYIADERRPP